MSALTNDQAAVVSPRRGTTSTTPTTAGGGARTAPGLAFAFASALAFGLAGALGRPLLEAGWSPGAVVVVRISIGAAVMAPLAAVAMRGRWGLLRRGSPTVVLYGVMAVAVAQLCYFAAIQYLQVGTALLIEYTAPAAVVVWLWVRHGQRPGPLTLVGAGLAAAGLVLVLDLVSGADLDLVGVLWALGAMTGLATYFVVSADDRSGLPPMALAGGGLLVGAAVLGLLGLAGVMPVRTADVEVVYAGVALPPWVPLLALGVITAAVAYSTGIAAGRRLGSRLASFVALSEVLLAVVWAWLLLGELPAVIQLAGGGLVLLGVVAVKLGERSTERVEPVTT